MLEEDLAGWFVECVAAYGGRPATRWTRKRKTQLLELMLRSDPHRSDRSISEQTGFSREFVAAHRRRLLEKKLIPAGHRVGIDGKNYLVAKAAKGDA